MRLFYYSIFSALCKCGAHGAGICIFEFDHG